MQNLTITQTVSPRAAIVRWSTAGLLIFWFLLVATHETAAQNDAFDVPARLPTQFGFPYPPPGADEPGVTFNRRYMLDGVPELNFHKRPEDEVWLVSSREMTGIHDESNSLICKRAIGDQWQRETCEVLLAEMAADRHRQTVIFVHGNRTDAFWARRRGKQAYQALVGNRTPPPMRFVIWAWPSEELDTPLAGPFRDFREKQNRTRVDGFWMGWFLSHMSRDVDPLLLTYSLGTQIAVTGLVDLQAAGIYRQYRMMALAPVTRCNWPEQTAELDAAASSIRQLTLMRNESDIAIRAFAIYCRICSPTQTESGVDMLDRRLPGTTQIDVSQGEGCQHNIVGYASLPAVAREFDNITAMPTQPIEAFSADVHAAADSTALR